MRGAINAFRDSLDDKCQFQQKPQNENAYKESHDSRDQVDQAIRGGFLEAQDHASDDGNAAGENPNDIEKLGDAAQELLLERKV
jgi:hypothetical protein